MSDTTHLEIPGHLSFAAGNGGLRKAVVETPWSTAEIYLHGAHVTDFTKKGEPPLLFMSGSSQYQADLPIRGGVPVIFPWFGPREGLPAHGFARSVEWNPERTELLESGAVRLSFALPAIEIYEVHFVVTVAETLTMELVVRNFAHQDAVFENCLHTYFNIGSIDDVSVSGLTGATFLDQLTKSDHIQGPEPIRFDREIDRVYFDTSATVGIADPVHQRVIRVAKSGSRSTVVWNPWIDKSARMPDFGDDEYRRMVCVESGNVSRNRITLAPGGASTLRVEIGSGPLT